MLTNVLEGLGLNRDHAAFLWGKILSIALLINSGVFDLSAQAAYLGIHLTPTGAHWIQALAVVALYVSGQYSTSSLPGAKTLAMWLLPLFLALSVQACAPPPITLSPAGVRAFQETRVVKAADVFRDFVIDANAQTPPMIDTATAKKIVQWHESALKVMQASTIGWQAAVNASLDEAVKDVPPAMAATIAPYVNLVKAGLKELN